MKPPAPHTNAERISTFLDINHQNHFLTHGSSASVAVAVADADAVAASA
jgi:hypothetical protein